MLYTGSELDVDPSKLISSNVDTTNVFQAQGESEPLCNMFGCDCIPPPNERCCTGYKYDILSRMCRRVIE